ncbi:protein phosphatase [Persephonella hydrogeniphila]|uniref:Protein phosphatase n=1 Tax=Persephonella hydrogeniphila TaxID=198703 RepID=A0A285NLL2_9AQUI|nr:PP2C family serine/threonine-protein phosphatase [Persephonella hydrogeniphila]SNZ08531.1 protein phosphatase [Persephonella hydrogeniphila]
MYKILFCMDIGMRDNQEDCMYIDGEIFQVNKMECPASKKVEKESLLVAVCDGMGGMSEGEKASRFVCQMLKKCSIPFSPEAVYRTLFRIQKKFETSGIIWSGTTVAGVLMEGNKSIIFNVGDSRVYKYTKDRLIYISHDHSYVQSLIDKGLISYEEAFYHPEKYIVEFGIGDVFASDWKSGKRPYIVEDILKKDEAYLVCTDGLSDYISDNEIYYLLYPEPFENFSNLIKAVEKVKSDNYSVALIGVNNTKTQRAHSY